MAYEKQNLPDGTVLKAEHLDHVEQGIVDTEEKIPENLKTENWVFTLADGSTVTKAVCVA